MTDRDEEVKATLKRATDRLIRYTLIYRKQNGGGGHRLTTKQRRRLTKKDRLLTTAPILRRPVSHGA